MGIAAGLRTPGVLAAAATQTRIAARIPPSVVQAKATDVARITVEAENL